MHMHRGEHMVKTCPKQGDEGDKRETPLALGFIVSLFTLQHSLIDMAVLR